MCFSLCPDMVCILSHALLFYVIPFAWCVIAFVLFCFVIACCTSSSLYICSALLLVRVGGGLAMITTWVSLRYVWVLSSNTNFEETNLIQGVPPEPALPNAPYWPFQLRRRVCRWGVFLNWSNLWTTFALIYPSRRHIFPPSPTLAIITRNFPIFSLINSIFRFWTILIFFFRLFCSTSSSQRRGERRRSSICNRFYLRQQQGVSQIWFYLRQEESVSQIWHFLLAAIYKVCKINRICKIYKICKICNIWF